MSSFSASDQMTEPKIERSEEEWDSLSLIGLFASEWPSWLSSGSSDSSDITDHHSDVSSDGEDENEDDDHRHQDDINTSHQETLTHNSTDGNQGNVNNTSSPDPKSDQNDNLEINQLLDWDLLTVEQVLDTPVWSGKLREAIFPEKNLIQLEDFLMRSQDILQKELEAHDYDTFSSFIGFYQNFRLSNQSLVQFVSRYDKDLRENEETGLSCVGLSLSLLERIQKSEPELGFHLSIVSCEEVVKEIGSYCMNSPNTLKEHVLLAMRIRIGNHRRGYILFDPGYHVSRPGMFWLI